MIALHFLVGFTEGQICDIRVKSSSQPYRARRGSSIRYGHHTVTGWSQNSDAHRDQSQTSHRFCSKRRQDTKRIRSAPRLHDVIGLDCCGLQATGTHPDAHAREPSRSSVLSAHRAFPGCSLARLLLGAKVRPYAMRQPFTFFILKRWICWHSCRPFDAGYAMFQTAAESPADCLRHSRPDLRRITQMDLPWHFGHLAAGAESQMSHVRVLTCPSSARISHPPLRVSAFRITRHHRLVASNKRRTAPAYF